MANDFRKKMDGTVVMVAGMPLPILRKNENAVRGGAVGGGVGALVAGLFMLSPLGIAILAAGGAFAGAALGADADRKA